MSLAIIHVYYVITLRVSRHVYFKPEPYDTIEFMMQASSLE